MLNSNVCASILQSANMLFGAIFVVRMFRLIGYLERVHPTTWEKLGLPSLGSARQRELYKRSYPFFSRPPDFRFSPAAKFVYFSSEYKTLADADLAKMIWSVRAFAAITALLVILTLIVVMHWPSAALYR